MNNPQYIEYLNTLGAEINVKSQLRTQTAILESEVDALEKQELKPSDRSVVKGLEKFPFFLRRFFCADFFSTFFRQIL